MGPIKSCAVITLMNFYHCWCIDICKENQREASQRSIALAKTEDTRCLLPKSGKPSKSILPRDFEVKESTLGGLNITWKLPTDGTVDGFILDVLNRLSMDPCMKTIFFNMTGTNWDLMQDEVMFTYTCLDVSKGQKLELQLRTFPITPNVYVHKFTTVLSNPNELLYHIENHPTQSTQVVTTISQGKLPEHPFTLSTQGTEVSKIQDSIKNISEGKLFENPGEHVILSTQGLEVSNSHFIITSTQGNLSEHPDGHVTLSSQGTDVSKIQHYIDQTSDGRISELLTEQDFTSLKQGSPFIQHSIDKSSEESSLKVLVIVVIVLVVALGAVGTAVVVFVARKFTRTKSLEINEPVKSTLQSRPDKIDDVTITGFEFGNIERFVPPESICTANDTINYSVKIRQINDSNDRDHLWDSGFQSCQPQGCHCSQDTASNGGLDLVSERGGYV